MQMTEADNLDPKRIFDDIRQETPQEKWPARHDAIKDCIKHTGDFHITHVHIII